MDNILVLNAGSSSIKFAIFHMGVMTEKMVMSCKGHISMSGAAVELKVEDAVGGRLAKCDWHPTDGTFRHDEALRWILGWIAEDRGISEIGAVGHRVVHGGVSFREHSLITKEVENALMALVPLAPLHQPHNLGAIRIVRDRWPTVPQIACFDTVFHQTQPAVAQAYALPQYIVDAGVRRYGFHGLSYEYVASQLPLILGSSRKVVVAHLGSGASLCAMEEGKSVATTMGFSALDGLVMGTRCGSLDPGVVLFLQQHLGMNVEEVSRLLYHQSGLLGMSGISSDMQALLESKAPGAAAAIDLFVYRAICEIGSMAAAMGGIDALVFTGGIGEQAAVIRSRIVKGCGWLGCVIDDSKNSRNESLVNAEGTIKVAVIPANEEYVIAGYVQAYLRKTQLQPE